MIHPINGRDYDKQPYVLDESGFAPMGSQERRDQIDRDLRERHGETFGGTAYGGGTYLYALPTDHSQRTLATYEAALDGPLGETGTVVLTKVGDGDARDPSLPDHVQ